jgi:Uma2 family endonuclease
MGVPKINTGPMTVEEFYAFTDTRPDEEKWELIDGEPVMQASPSFFHQLIVFNIIVALGIAQRAAPDCGWRAIPGIGVRLSGISRPEPDVMVVPIDPTSVAPSQRDLDNVLVVFEVISPSSVDRDLHWKRNAYSSLASLAHYVVVAQDAVDVVVFAHETGFAEQRLSKIGDVITFAGLGVTLPLAEIYRDTGLA